MLLYVENFIEVEMHDKENNQIISMCSKNDFALENLEEKSAFEEKDTMKKEVCRFLYTCE
jgi:hypothetical protein